ncbi:MAG: ABC transporter substrate-binding protein [Clostridiales bacterium]|nr:ABC transporter substrate-binding protein [Clostridiales bacterium]
MKKITWLLVIVLIFAFALTACSAPAAEKNTDDQVAQEVVKFGIFEPLTGAYAAGGAMELEGIELAHELYPEVLGMKIEVISLDNKSDKVESANAATKLVDQEKVNVVIGSWGSSFSMAAGPIVEEAGIPAIGTSCTNPLVTLGNDYYFRVTFIDSFQGVVMANYAYDVLDARKVVIVQDISNDYAVGLASFFTNEFIRLTGDEDAIVSVVNYNTGDQDFTAQLTNIKGLNPDAIFAPGGYSESAMLIKQAKELDLKAPFIGGDSWEAPEFLEIGGEAVNGAVFSTFFDAAVPLTPESEVFIKAYREKYGKDPASVTALAYDAYILAIDAIERANSTDPQAIRDALAETVGFDGAAGIVTLDANGDAVKNAVIKTVKNNEFTYLTTISPK